MVNNAKTFQKSGKFTLTKHASDRIRQRIGIADTGAQTAWVNESIAKAGEINTVGNYTTYTSDSFASICDGLKVVTIKPVANTKTYLKTLGGAVTKEVQKMLVPHERLLRKAEIKVAELTLNYLKARNPNTKKMINKRLVEATDEKQLLVDEVYAIKKAAGRYGVEV